MDFTISTRTEDFRRRITEFVDREILPAEAEAASYDTHGNITLGLLGILRAKAQAQGLWCLQLDPEYGGQGLKRAEMAVCYEAMNRSIFGPVVFNSAAPDDGNMMVLQALGTEDQKDRWLRPIADGRVRSALAMTEPHPGGGSDPGMIRTVAERTGDTYRITGRKWFITGAEEAEHLMVIARTSDDARRGLTAFLFHKDQPGWQIERRIGIMGPEEHGGHCELTFEGLEVPARDVLAGEGRGLKVTQVRLGIARLTHSMRWLGLAKRCVEIARDYAENRMNFGMRLADRESIQIKLGDLAMQIEIGRLLVMRAAWELDQGGFARAEVSMAKIHVANLLHKAADTAIQINGARGYSTDTVLEWIYRYARQARLVDGADEVHQMVLNRILAEQRADFWELAGGMTQGIHFNGLEAYLGTVLGGAGPAQLDPVRGGQSNPTYFLTFAGRRLVLRSQPTGPILRGAHAIDREFRVLGALAPTGVPVPKVIAFCDDANVIGAPFYLMERLDGRVFHDCALPELPRDERAAIYGGMARALALLHAVDPDAIGLSDFGRPGNYLARQVSRWSRQYADSPHPRIADLDAMVDWLPANMPPDDDRTAIAHGDFRLGNMLFHPTEPRVIGILDWELSTIGHPLADLGFSAIPWLTTPDEYGGILGLNHHALGLPGIDEFLDAYYASAIPTPQIASFHFVFALFRFAVIFVGIADRAAAGNAASDEAAKLAPLAAKFARRAYDVAHAATAPHGIAEKTEGLKS